MSPFSASLRIAHAELLSSLRDRMTMVYAVLLPLALYPVLLFVVLWWYGSRPRGLGQVSGAFLVGYGVLRFVAEWFREPDSFLGLLALGLSMGQWLCLPMVAAGAWLMARPR